MTKEDYYNEARNILENIYFNASEIKPKNWKTMILSLAIALEKRDGKSSSER